MALVKYIREKGISSSMRRFLPILLFLLPLISPVLASANSTTIVFSDSNLFSSSNLEVYAQNGTNGTWELMGIYNTRSQLVFEPGNYNVNVKPASASPWGNLDEVVPSFFAFVQTYWIPLLIIAVVIAIARRR
jgi:hypothetical protein